MFLFPLSLLLGVLAGIAIGGRPSLLTTVRVRRPALVVAALGVQAALGLPSSAHLPAGVRLALLAVSYSVAGLWLASNVPGRSRGVAAGLVATIVGWLLNMSVVLANIGMPVSVSALGHIGANASLLRSGGPLGKHVALGVGSSLAALGDTIPLPPLRSVVSVGDLVMIAGLVVAVAAAMQVPALRRRVPYAQA